jgi:lipoyl(octanoyl) transferase|tara:strand:- start:427 stop:1044 length:618 start_codon:yes stop_codon:yes gene_type:complete
LIQEINIRNLGKQDYKFTWESMQKAVLKKDEESSDEVWLLEHKPVFTLGQAGKEENILNSDDIPVVRTDRGGEVTYHGPGQLVVYFMLNLRRRGWGPKKLIEKLETLIIVLLDGYGINAERKTGAPGIYIANKKIASIGLKIKKGFSYHGISINVDMDLMPFKNINPCGYDSLEMTQLSEHADISMLSVEKDLKLLIAEQFGEDK